MTDGEAGVSLRKPLPTVLTLPDHIRCGGTKSDPVPTVWRGGSRGLYGRYSRLPSAVRWALTALGVLLRVLARVVWAAVRLLLYTLVRE